jgi:hypothetical protein
MIKIHKSEQTSVAELTDENLVISSGQDVLDLMGELFSDNCSTIILREKNLHPDFFRLQTGLAGDILQKFSNYNMKLAVIGDFSKYKSKNLIDFIRESNRGNRIFFLDSLDAALDKLAHPPAKTGQK